MTCRMKKKIVTEIRSVIFYRFFCHFRQVVCQLAFFILSFVFAPIFINIVGNSPHKIAYRIGIPYVTDRFIFLQDNIMCQIFGFKMV